MPNIIRPWDQSPHTPKGSEFEDPYDYYEKLKRRFEARALGVYRSANRPEVDHLGRVIHPSARIPNPEADKNPNAPAFIMLSIECDVHRPAKPIYSCRHTITLDEVHPERIYFMPFGYYLCGTCFRLLEERKMNYRKLEEQGVVTCWTCLSDIITKLKQRDPTLFVDLMVNPKG